MGQENNTFTCRSNISKGHKHEIFEVCFLSHLSIVPLPLQTPPKHFRNRLHPAKAGLRIRIRIRSDPDLFGRIRIILTGSGSYRYFDNVKLYKQGKTILKIEVLKIFRWIFPFFQIKIIIIQIKEEICLMWNKFRCLNWFLVSASEIRIRSRIRF